MHTNQGGRRCSNLPAKVTLYADFTDEPVVQFDVLAVKKFVCR